MNAPSSVFNPDYCTRLVLYCNFACLQLNQVAQMSRRVELRDSQDKSLTRLWIRRYWADHDDWTLYIPHLINQDPSDPNFMLALQAAIDEQDRHIVDMHIGGQRSQYLAGIAYD